MRSLPGRVKPVADYVVRTAANYLRNTIREPGLTDRVPQIVGGGADHVVRYRLDPVRERARHASASANSRSAALISPRSPRTLSTARARSSRPSTTWTPGRAASAAPQVVVATTGEVRMTA